MPMIGPAAGLAANGPAMFDMTMDGSPIIDKNTGRGPSISTAAGVMAAFKATPASGFTFAHLHRAADNQPPGPPPRLRLDRFSAPAM